MKNHYIAQVLFRDHKVAWQKRVQCMDKASALYGAIEQVETGYTGAQSGGIRVADSYILAFYTPESKYHQDPEMLARAIAAVEYALRLQNEDGTLDLPSTNFHDAAETAFAINAMYPAYAVMRELSKHSAPEDLLDARIQEFFNRSADGILKGGFHTPNHRWVISAALASIARLADRTDCLEYMRKFLNEGIDCDEEGEFTERSAGVYNIVCDNSLFVLANERYMPELYGPIARNLNMVTAYFEPDGHVNTMNSTRQDKGLQPESSIYYGCFLAMALKTRDAGFAWMADEMLEQLRAKTVLDPLHIVEPFGFMHLFLLDRQLIDEQKEIVCLKPSLRYDHYFKASGIVRRREGDFSATLVRGLPDFLKLQFERHEVHVRLAGCFYARGQFAPQSIERIEGGYRMLFHDRWGYKRPFTQSPGTSDWRQMDHSKRENVSMQDFDLLVDVLFSENGATLRVKSTGCENVPVKLELIVEPDGKYSVDDMEMWLRKGAYVYQKCLRSRYQFTDLRSLSVEGGFFAHTFGEKMRGTLPGEGSSASIAMTAYTPFDKSLTLQFE